MRGLGEDRVRPPAAASGVGHAAGEGGGVLWAFVLAFRQLLDPSFMAVTLRAIGLSLVVFAALAACVWWLLAGAGLYDGWFSWVFAILGWLGVSWLFDVLAWLIFAGVVWMLFPAVVTLFVGVFLEDVARAVEARHYPDEPTGADLSMGRSLIVGAKLTVVIVLVNLVALPAYLVLFLFPPTNLFVFYGLNGYLLSREYFDLVALRHVDEVAARGLRRRYQGRLFVAGLMIVFLLTVPLVNLVAPIVGTAAMVHLHRSLSAADRGTPRRG